MRGSLYKAAMLLCRIALLCFVLISCESGQNYHLIEDALRFMESAEDIRTNYTSEANIIAPLNTLHIVESVQAAGDRKTKASKTTYDISMTFMPENSAPLDDTHITATTYRYMEGEEQVLVTFDQDGNVNNTARGEPIDLPGVLKKEYFDELQFLEYDTANDTAIYRGIKHMDVDLDSLKANIASEEFILALMTVAGFIPSEYRIYVDISDRRITRVTIENTFAFEADGLACSIDGATEIDYQYEDADVVLPDDIHMYAE